MLGLSLVLIVILSVQFGWLFFQWIGGVQQMSSKYQEIEHQLSGQSLATYLSIALIVSVFLLLVL